MSLGKGGSWSDMNDVATRTQAEGCSFPPRKTSPRMRSLLSSVINAADIVSTSDTRSVYEASKGGPSEGESLDAKENGCTLRSGNGLDEHKGGDSSENTMGPVPILGSLGLRRVNKAQSQQQTSLSTENKDSSLDSKSSATPAWTAARPPQNTTAAGAKKATSSNLHHRHPGPISLPPPAPFLLNMHSPHRHRHHPHFHGHALHPLGSPLHHPLYSPLHHPGHPPPTVYGVPGVPYGLVTPAGLSPMTPSMPPFTFCIRKRRDRPRPNSTHLRTSKRAMMKAKSQVLTVTTRRNQLPVRDIPKLKHTLRRTLPISPNPLLMHFTMVRSSRPAFLFHPAFRFRRVYWYPFHRSPYHY